MPSYAFKLKLPLAGLTLAALLTACGGGSSSTSALTSSLSGVVAVGAPLPNATVILKDATGKVLTQTSDANGAYTFSDVSDVTAPLMLQATGAAGGTSYTLHATRYTAY